MLIRVTRFRGTSPDVAAEAEFTETGGTIGRSSQCTLPLPDEYRHISRIQAEINFENGHFMLVDRGSAGVVQHNGEELGSGKTARLKDGDELNVGDYVLRVEFPMSTTTRRQDQLRQQAVGGWPEQDGGSLPEVDPTFGGLLDAASNPSPVKGKPPGDLIPTGFDFGQSLLAPSGRKDVLGMPVQAGQNLSADDSLDKLWDLQGKADALSLPLGDKLSAPNTAGHDDPLAAFSVAPDAGAAPMHDNGEEIHSPIHLPVQAPQSHVSSFAQALPPAGASLAGRTVTYVRKETQPARQAPRAVHGAAGMLPAWHGPAVSAKAGKTPARSTPQREAGHQDMRQQGIPQQGNDALLAAFLSGVGMEELPRALAPSGQVARQVNEEFMQGLGRLLRLFTQGTIDLLATRASLKTEMRAPMTIIASKDNNPLKFSPDSATALALLLSSPMPKGFMQPDAAVTDATNDLVAHQVAVIAGMRAALEGLLSRFKPDTLAKRLTNKSMLDSMLPMNRKAKLWEQFEAIYGEVSKEAEDDFDALFSREFVRAYEQQVNALETNQKRDTPHKKRR
jgi:type VI secretion system FHA domain protein